MSASAGSRTRIDCLEGNHANRYTTDAFVIFLWHFKLDHTCPIILLLEICEEQGFVRGGLFNILFEN